MFVSDVSDFSFVGKVEPYFLSAGEEVVYYCGKISNFHALLIQKFLNNFQFFFTSTRNFKVKMGYFRA